MIAAALAVAAAAAWGVGDFLGGLKSRSFAPIAVLAVAQPIGLAALAVWVGIRGVPPPGSEVLWACFAAALGTTGLVAFYRGMAAGALSVVAPIAGAGAAIPVVWGLATGDQPSRLQEIGFAAALLGVVLTSWERGGARTRVAAGVGWALIAMIAFGGYYVPMHVAGRADFLWAAFIFRATSTLLVLTACSIARPKLPGRRDLTALAAIGLLDTGGNVFFAAASARGFVSVVSVLASLYPVVTVLLARMLLRERVERSQELGVVLALAGIVLVSAG